VNLIVSVRSTKRCRISGGEERSADVLTDLADKFSSVESARVVRSMSSNPANVRNPEALLHTANPSLEELLDIIKAEFLEMPGLLLTRPQFQRLWGLDITTCDRVIESLVASHFLIRTADGHYRRYPSED
jgi:hypothetical protein